MSILVSSDRVLYNGSSVVPNLKSKLNHYLIIIDLFFLEEFTGLVYVGVIS